MTKTKTRTMKINKDLARILRQSDKAAFLDFINRHIASAEKCLVILAVPDGNGGLTILESGVGFEYQFELVGFLSVFMNTLNSEGGDEGYRGGDDDED